MVVMKPVMLPVMVTMKLICNGNNETVIGNGTNETE